jgi:hypothetical protein
MMTFEDHDQPMLQQSYLLSLLENGADSKGSSSFVF